MSSVDETPRLDGVHHVKLPVSDLARSEGWYASRLGYRPVIRFTASGRHTGTTMAHPRGGPMLGLVLHPDLAARASGFDYFSIGVPDKAALEALAARLTGMGETHAGVHFATIGWILPRTHDPDGHEVRFYTTDHHTDLDQRAEPLVVEDPVGTSVERERAHLEGRAGKPTSA
jgi:catechol 2,3-dioxygenase-like lactoylglutathione lyase family enzyme